jgi:phosphoenolpyruvate mutase
MIIKKHVYIGLASDVINTAHINLFKKAKKLGKLTVGLFSDKAVIEYKKLPNLNFKQRYNLVSSIKYIDNVIKQDEYDYSKNLNLLKPDYVIHGNKWRGHNGLLIRKKIIQSLKKWNGKLIEVNYDHHADEKSFDIEKKILTSDNRISKLKRLIESKDIVRVLESHNSLTGLIIEKMTINKKGKLKEFDCMWSSSLTDSATKGKPDNQAVDYSSRIRSLNDMLDVTTKPLIFDADNGGRIEHLSYLVKSLERTGVSAIIMEDKVGLKMNSLFSDQLGAKQDTPNAFSKKIAKVCDVRRSKDFLVIARIESFILNKGLNDALKRAEIYSKAGADAILIHSKEKTPKEIFQFSKIFKKTKYSIPLVAVPSTYSEVYEKDLILNGFKIVIYANQLLRSAYPAMVNTAKKILLNSRAYEADKNIIPIKEIINLIKND